MEVLQHLVKILLVTVKFHNLVMGEEIIIFKLISVEKQQYRLSSMELFHLEIQNFSFFSLSLENFSDDETREIIVFSSSIIKFKWR